MTVELALCIHEAAQEQAIKAAAELERVIASAPLAELMEMGTPIGGGEYIFPRVRGLVDALRSKHSGRGFGARVKEINDRRLRPDPPLRKDQMIIEILEHQS